MSQWIDLHDSLQVWGNSAQNFCPINIILYYAIPENFSDYSMKSLFF